MQTSTFFSCLCCILSPTSFQPYDIVTLHAQSSRLRAICNLIIKNPRILCHNVLIDIYFVLCRINCYPLPHEVHGQQMRHAWVWLIFFSTVVSSILVLVAVKWCIAHSTLLSRGHVYGQSQDLGNLRHPPFFFFFWALEYSKTTGFQCVWVTWLKLELLFNLQTIL